MEYSVSVRSTGSGVACEASNRGWTFTFDPDQDSSPRAIEYLLFSLGACTASTVGRYMTQKGLSTKELEVVVSAEFDDAGKRYRAIKVELRPGGNLSESDKRSLRAVARSCRIHKTLEDLAPIPIEMVGLSPVDS